LSGDVERRYGPVGCTYGCTYIVPQKERFHFLKIDTDTRSENKQFSKDFTGFFICIMSSTKEPLSYQQAHQIEYYKKHREKFREKSSERYRNLTPEVKKQISIKKMKWYQENKDAVKLREYKRYWEKRRGF
jgi:hypothetical protein